VISAEAGDEEKPASLFRTAEAPRTPEVHGTGATQRMRTLMILLLLLVLSPAATTRAQDMERGPTEGTRPPEPTPVPGVTPTADRLAAPPTVPAPTQADDGAQLYWLHCQPCHGDQGQGLTDDWRAQYPEEDRNCWNSGCHGEQPYDSGFTIPTVVPGVVGENIHQKFPSDGALYQYIRASMPYWNPASLTDEEYLAITAHLARVNGRWDGRTLTVDGLAAEQAAPQTPLATAATSPTPLGGPRGGSSTWAWGGLAVAVIIVVGILLWRRANHTN
jgi:hypothetical protein